ncbi:hypothetical protein ACIQZI_13295 [Peribacillus sp. NPDC096379]
MQNKIKAINKELVLQKDCWFSSPLQAAANIMERGTDGMNGICLQDKT